MRGRGWLAMGLVVAVVIGLRCVLPQAWSVALWTRPVVTAALGLAYVTLAFALYDPQGR